MYLWDLDHGFAGVVLIKKAGDNDKIKGCWDSIHVVEVQVSHLLSAGSSRNPHLRCVYTSTRSQIRIQIWITIYMGKVV